MLLNVVKLHRTGMNRALCYNLLLGKGFLSRTLVVNLPSDNNPFTNLSGLCYHIVLNMFQLE